MKICIVASDKITDFSFISDKLSKSEFDITEVVIRDKEDKLIKIWAKESQLPVKQFSVNWKDTECEGAVVVQGKFGPYNKMAAKFRDEEMVEYADAFIIFEAGVNDMHHLKRTIIESDKPVEEYTSEELKVYVF